MQGFPDNFFLANSRTKSMKLLGNSVAVNAVYHVGKNILDYLCNKEEFFVKSTFGLNKLPK